jgi:hypothetical protein
LMMNWSRSSRTPASRTSDPEIADDRRSHGAERVLDVREANHGKWRHSMSKCLRWPRLRAAPGDMLDL